MRAFIALDLPSEIKAEMQSIQAALRVVPAEVAWTKPENFHLTLKFFAELAETRVSDVIDAAQVTAAQTQMFRLQLGATGVFPHARQPRILWAGLQGDLPLLRQLQARLDQRLTAAGFASEAQGFRPHLTLGRLKSRRAEADLMAALPGCAVRPLTFSACEIKLIRSELHPNGARYTTLATLPFEEERRT